MSLQNDEPLEEKSKELAGLEVNDNGGELSRARWRRTATWTQGKQRDDEIEGRWSSLRNPVNDDDGDQEAESLNHLMCCDGSGTRWL